MAFGFYMPSAQGGPAPLDVEDVFYGWQPDPNEFLFSQMFPGREYRTPSVNFDLVGGATGGLSDGSLDGDPSPEPPRARYLVSLAPLFKERLEELYPSDAINQRAYGTLNEINPQELATLMGEECAVAVWTQREIDTIAALNGSLTPTLFGGAGASYSYGTQTFDVTNTGTGGGGALWSDLLNSNPINDIIQMSLLMRGYGYEPELFFNAKVGLYLAQNAGLVNLAKQSGFADMIGPGGAVGQIGSTQGVCSLLKSFTGVAGVTCYDRGYQTLVRSTGVYTYHPVLADTAVMMIGKAPRNQTRGWFGFTPTPNKSGILTPEPGPWVRQYDRSKDKPKGRLQVYCGYAGIPALPFPKIVVNATVAS